VQQFETSGVFVNRIVNSMFLVDTMYRLIVLLFTSLTCLSSSTGKELSTAEAHSVLQKCIAAQELNDANADSYICTGSEGANGKYESATILVARKQNSVLCEMKSGRFINNGTYIFGITRSGTSWSLVTYNSKKIAIDWHNLVDRKHLAVYPFSAIRPDCTLRMIVDSPDFTLNGAEQESNSACKIRYTATTPVINGRGGLKIRGELLVSDNDGRYILSSTTFADTTPLGHSVSTKLERSLNREALLPIKVKYVISNGVTGSEIATHLAEYSSDSAKSILSDELHLPFYGIDIPKDDIYEDRGFNWMLWGGAGAILILMSIVLKILATKLRRRQMK
jgi:hypothetical protein